MSVRRNRGRGDAVVSYMRGERRTRIVSESRATATIAAGMTSAYTQECLRSSVGNSLPELLAVTRERRFFVIPEESFS